MLLPTLLLIGASLLLIAYVLCWFFAPIWRSISAGPAFRLSATFVAEDGLTKPFPNLFENNDAEVNLSVVIPAYNEQDRMAVMLNETLKFLDQRKKRDRDLTYEVIIVNDGSKDRTQSIAQSYTNANGSDTVRVLSMAKNSGKGAAVQSGVLHARGNYILMVDADGASRFSDIKALETELKVIENNGQGIAIGSRAHLQEQAIAERNFIRTVLMFGFHIIVKTVAGVSIRDTQCGFKLFARATARDLFANLHLMRWAFDVELIFMASRTGVPMVEVPIHWIEIPGSKVSLVDSVLTMFRDIVAIRICYLTGLWVLRPWQDSYKLVLRSSTPR